MHMDSAQSRNLAAELTALDTKINALLPPRYQHCYAGVSPDSMGSAGLKYDLDGKVAWDEIWTTFCDLALAGGPPHRGSLLEPPSEADVTAAPSRYRDVVAEIGRAVRMTTCLRVVDGYGPGWIGIRCDSPAEAGWLKLAVNAENVSARSRSDVLQLPAGPDFRAQKEIKNVVVALAKTAHYWDGHLTAEQQSLAGADAWEAATADEVAAAPTEYETAVREIENALSPVGLSRFRRQYVGWIGIETDHDEDAVWLLRAILVERITARREGSVLYLPVGATPRPNEADRIGRAFQTAYELWTASRPRRPAWQPSGRFR
jgi:sirohydrochlorin cobaltochelatase